MAAFRVARAFRPWGVRGGAGVVALPARLRHDRRRAHAFHPQPVHTMKLPLLLQLAALTHLGLIAAGLLMPRTVGSWR